MPLILPGNVGSATAATGYNVANSARFNDGSSDTLTRTPGSASNRRTFTISFWVKRGAISSAHQNVFSSGAYGSTQMTQVFFEATDELFFSDFAANQSQNFLLKTNRLFRDPSAWYHIFIAVDTTQGTASNRIKIYVNGVQETSFATESYPDQNFDCAINVDQVHTIGNRNGASLFFDGYLSEFVFVDGTAQAHTDVGEFDSDSGIWKPINVSGLTFGTNGFYLNFETSAELGDDVSGNTNDFTETNLTAVDQSTDTCTNNFATLNSLDSFSSGAAFSEGNTTVTSTNGGRGIITATFGLTSGKWYWEVKTSATGGTNSGDEWNHIGIANRSAANADNILAESGTGSNKVYEYSYYAYDGNHWNNGDQGGYGASFTTNDIIGVFLDLDNNKIYWSKNGAWADGSGNSDENDPNGFKAVTDPASTPGGVYIPACSDGGVNVFKTWQWNFGGTPGFAISSGNSDPNGYGNFEYPTEGGYAICTKNLAEYGG